MSSSVTQMHGEPSTFTVR